MKPNKIFIVISASILALFALLTLFLSSSIIFDWFGVRAKEGNYVLFIVGINFSCAILYLTAVYGFIFKKLWTFKVLLTALFILLLGFIGLLIHINNGNLYETKTVGAMVFRIVFTLIFLVIAKKTLKK
ncbi:MAG: hypothetical protein R2816_08450 [Flavobacteriaceae bacterium]|nr:hypothetical protein [Flavobacteriaceae bacterium]